MPQVLEETPDYRIAETETVDPRVQRRR